MTRRLGWVGVALSTIAILVATLQASGTELPPGWSFYLSTGESALAELVQNLLLFLPLGACLTLAGVRARWTVLIGAALSCSVEFAQQWIPGRDPSTGDIICNTLSTGLGVACVLAAPRWLHTTPGRAARQALAAATAAVLVWLGTGIAVRPILPPPPYHDVWTPDFTVRGHHYSKYQGKVLGAQLGGDALSQHIVADAVALVTAGQPLAVTVIAPNRPPPPGQTSPLIALLDNRTTPVLMLSVDGTDLVVHYRMTASDLTLEQLDLRWRRALPLARIAPQDTFVAQTWRGERGICLALNADRRCGYGFTIGDGWKLIYYPKHFPAWLYALLNTLWLAGWTIGVGWWGRRAGRAGRAGRAIVAAGAVVLLGLLLVPLLTDLQPTPLHEWLGAALGLIGGYTLASFTPLTRPDLTESQRSDRLDRSAT